MTSWIYSKSKDNTCRYTLGLKGQNMLICCGINPSTAKPDSLDNTVRRVEKFSKDNGYDGYIMINVYPQISTNPKEIHSDIDESIHKENIRCLDELFMHYPRSDIWAAWGTLIETRPYFCNALREIVTLSKKHNLNWIHFNELTKARHPRHPLYLKSDSKISKFDIEGYIDDRLASVLF
ncbi:MAG: DUF1643 domain-containing protein [Gudongella sp.]|nr:DUF1643 domain-containing protein [Gudongella sp.]